MNTGLLIGYFLEHQEAITASRQLKKKGFRRVALIGKSAEGKIQIVRPLLQRWCFGVKKEVIENHGRWLVPGDTALILVAPIETLKIPAKILLESEEATPAVFVLHPKRERLLRDRRERGFGGSLLSPNQLHQHALRLAAEHRLDPKPLRNTDLLKRLERGREWIQQICRDLGEASHLQQSVPPTAEWLLDNEYILESNARDVRLNLPWSFYRQLPALANEKDLGLPRVYSLAHELAARSELLVDEQNIMAFIEAYQSVTSLSIGELWAIPQMLRMALVEGIEELAGRALSELREQEIADFWAHRLITANRREPRQLFAIMAELAKAYPSPSPYFASQLNDYLYDEEAAMAPVKGWLEHAFQKSLNEIILRVKDQQTRDQISIGNAFTSLRLLAVLDWKVCFERLSRVEAILKRDPAGIYSTMDFPTRDRYRRAIEDLRRGSGLEEEHIAKRVVELAASVHEDSALDDRSIHIGTYLIGDKRGELARLIGCREALRFRALNWVYRHHSSVYFLGLAFFSVMLIFLALRSGAFASGLGFQFLFAALLFLPASQISLELLNTIIIKLFPVRALPKLDFSTSGIPGSCRTLVVVPMMLVDRATIKGEVEKLEIRYLANKEDNLLFSLFSDYSDASTAHCDTDEGLLQYAIESIQALNQRYGGKRFLLLHRERKWSDCEQKFIGWERKRGKLEELNNLIVGNRPCDAEPLVRLGNPAVLASLRFVITLDSDTQLPANAARRMIETLAHPLNRARFDESGRVVSGYTIIQPRVSPSLPSANGTPFSRLFSDPIGIDPYTNTVSDVYQDLSGEGSYHGKGIYDVQAFNKIVSGKFPDALLLSHDLIEGAHVRVGFASDIELYDEFPQDFLSYAKRQHRWIRGDWQIANWVMSRVPQADGSKGPNPLSWLDRWKICDNLRRSLLPVASLALLMSAWLISPRAGVAASMVVAAQLFFHSLVQPLTWAASGRGFKRASIQKAAHDLLRMIIEAALLPFQAWLALDAIGRVWYRRRISHRGLLEWTSAQAMNVKSQAKVRKFVFAMNLASLFSLSMGGAVGLARPANLGIASPWLLLWILSPLFGWLLNRRPHTIAPREALPEEDLRFLKNVARRTWRYFTDFVNEESSWLPPDNFQVFYQKGLAFRTSPTNIGLYLVSVLSAFDFGYLSVDEVAQKLTKTMKTIEKLERHEGHLLNWYDIKTLAPLNPRYVSMVDSGNLLGSLWTLRRGLESLVNAPLLDKKALAGLHDTNGVLQHVGREGQISGDETHALNELEFSLESSSASIIDILCIANKIQSDLPPLAAKAETAYWSAQVRSRAAAWQDIADRYLAWIEILSEKTEEEITILIPGATAAFRAAFNQAPSLKELASGTTGCIAFLESIQLNVSANDSSFQNWIDRIEQAHDRAKWLAGEMLAIIDRLSRACSKLSESMNMCFLFNTERRLFSIGYNVSEGRLDHAFYDLLASEARLGSFVAIARGDIPAEHWFAMGRPYGAIGHRRVLLSWTGTMFEYLMPLLFQRTYKNSLLDKAVKEAVAIQIAFGLKHHVPWGISECAFGDIDIQKAYQYQAFGVPELGLKRGLAEKIVVAPYASLLAVSIVPQETVLNLKRFAELGLLGDYGYLESLDYSRQSMYPVGRGVIVHAYMAHHQGMIFLALTNFLQNDYLKRQFRADPRIRMVEPLLQERIPIMPPLHHVTTRERVSSVASVGEAKPSVSQFETPHTSRPKTQLLCNGTYSLMLTNVGGGYSRWGNFELTRWRSDLTQDSWGTFCYIRDVESSRLWCAAYQPIRGHVEQFSANFSLDRAVFRRLDSHILTETEIIIAPEDDVEIRRMTLVNRSSFNRRLELTSYIELALAPHNVDRQHPAFNKMFIQTEAVPEQQALLAYRRLRSASDPPIYVAHRFTLEPVADEPADRPLRFETDRRRFIGRGRTLANPMGAEEESGCSQGFVLDPILSLRKSIALAPGKRVQISMILAAGASRETVLSLIDTYSSPQAIDRAMEFAWSSAQLELRLLRIQNDEARNFQQLASHLLYPQPLLRAASQRIAENRKGQSGLWTYAISGDVPIALVVIDEARDLGLVRQMLQAHNYWRMHGLLADLVILNEESSGYNQPLREEILHLIQALDSNAGTGRPGGTFLLNEDNIPSEDLTLLQAAASVVLIAARGNLTQQFAVPALELLALSAPIARKRDPPDPLVALPFMELPFFNSLGGFSPDGREYIIYLGPGMNSPAPWGNVIANPGFGTIVSEIGAGFTWQGNSQRNRLTQWSNDPVMDPSPEAIFLRDEDTGSYWTPTASPVREETAYRARHGAGYTVFEHNSHGIEQELTVFVPLDDKGGEPIKLQKMVLRNASSRLRRLSLTYYAELTMGESRESSQMHIVTAWDDEAQAMLIRNRYHPEYGDRVAFAALSAVATSYTGDRTAFIGRNRTLGNPAAMDRIRLAGRSGAGLDPCVAIQVMLKLAPGERVEVACMLGQAESTGKVHSLVSKFRDLHAVEAALRETKAWWDTHLEMIQVHTPELAADIMINRWLQYQSLSSRIWGRTGFYQSGGAFGFRDQLQDVMALLHAHPGLARGHILLAASRQFREGDVQHWWHPPSGAGIRSCISDDLLWLPYVVAQYIRVTADASILDELVPFIDAPLLTDTQVESFQLPSITVQKATLFEHCQRALAHSQRFGVHGLPLMGTGDWNDAMNLVGVQGKGESVWLAWFMIDVLKGMVELSAVAGLSELGQSYEKERSALIEHVENFAWDGEWYVRATFDDGTILGASENSEAQIDSLPQSWAALSGAGDKERTEKALESAWKHLVHEEEKLVQLFNPPFDTSIPSPGYIKGYPPGVRENGGQYTHAAIWLAMAMARQGDGTRAVKILRMLNPIEHSHDPEAVWRYGVEPYVVVADIYRLPGRIGQGGWSWYTGSAAWMYRAWVEEILGLKIRGGTMEISPVIPGWWDGFQMTYRHGDAMYEIHVENPEHRERGVSCVDMDGVRIEDGIINLVATLSKHEVIIRMGEPK
jgi:cyclic beta-1,2-glucan synthetase